MGKPDESNNHLRQSTANFRVPFVVPSEIYPSVWKHIIEAARNSEQEMVERFKQVASVQAEFEEQWKEQWNRTSQGVAEAVKRTLLRVKLLGELGWTMPMEMSWPEFQALAMEDDLTVERVNQWFVTYYTEDNASGFKRLAGGLLSSRQLDFWKLLVRQCVRAFEKGDFALCVPSLLLILEGSIAKPWGVTFENPKTRRVFFERKLSAAASGSIKEYKWRSVQGFTDSVFGRKGSPTKLHRHLILHGKSDPATWDRAYCLRLFQAISTVVSLSKESLAVRIERNRKSASSHR